jgi:hypothetical protein
MVVNSAVCKKAKRDLLSPKFPLCDRFAMAFWSASAGGMHGSWNSQPILSVRL